MAAVAVALGEAHTPAFKKYAAHIIKNAKVLAGALTRLGWRIVSGGTDTHLLLVDTWQRGLGSKKASDILENAGIIVNKNTIPFDTRSPVDPSGIRIGTAAVTTRGMKEKEMKIIASLFDRALKGENPARVRREVESLIKKFPIP
jgi:glycine hydroxymethyltransferase